MSFPNIRGWVGTVGYWIGSRNLDPCTSLVCNNPVRSYTPVQQRKLIIFIASQNFQETAKYCTLYAAKIKLIRYIQIHMLTVCRLALGQEWKKLGFGQSFIIKSFLVFFRF